MIIILPLIFFIEEINFASEFLSRPFDGSSNNSIFGLEYNALAKASLPLPPENRAPLSKICSFIPLGSLLPKVHALASISAFNLFMFVYFLKQYYLN